MKFNTNIKTGYKATDKDMKCRGFQFELGKWFEHEGELELCKSGFHFCTYPSGVWNYYTEVDTRVFKVEVEDVLDTEISAGADVKLVCRKIKFLEEICIGGDWNTGNRNTGNRNTGDGNTGNWNTGNWNTGNRNIGYWNTGNRNTGDRNTGYWNTGNRNTGNRNTGNRNTGDGNTGNRNTGNWNTGYGNATNYSSGFFCIEEPNVICFDVCTGLKRAEFIKRYPEYYELSKDLLGDAPIIYDRYKNIPNITEEKLKKLHDKFIEERKKK